MQVLRTTKKVDISIMSDSTNRVEFRYRYAVDWKGSDIFSIRVDAYNIDDEGAAAQGLIPEGGSYRDLPQEQYEALLGQAEQLTPAVDNETSLEYFNRVIATGIKLVIVSEGLWKGQLGMGDFE